MINTSKIIEFIKTFFNSYDAIRNSPQGLAYYDKKY